MSVTTGATQARRRQPGRSDGEVRREWNFSEKIFRKCDIRGVRRLAAALSNDPRKDLVEPGSRAYRPPKSLHPAHVHGGAGSRQSPAAEARISFLRSRKPSRIASDSSLSFFLDGWRRQVVARGRATSGGRRWLRKFVISPFAAFFP